MTEPPSDFEDLLRQAQRPVLGYLIRLTGSVHAAQDILQTANVTAISKQESFSAGTDLVAWLRTIAMNHYRNQVRKESGARETMLVDDDLHDLIEQRHRQRIEKEEWETKWQRAMECIQQLPEHQRDAVLQFYLKSQTLVQIAESTGRKANAIGQTLYRARLAILQCMERNSDMKPKANPVQPSALSSERTNPEMNQT